MPPERLGQFGCPANMGVQFHFKLHCKAPRASPCRRCLFSWFPARNTATTKKHARTHASIQTTHASGASLPVRMSSQHGRAISSYRTRPMHLGLLHAIVAFFRGSLPETATETCTHTPTCILDHASGASWSVRMSCQHGNANGFQHDRTKAPWASPCHRCLSLWFPARNTATTKKHARTHASIQTTHASGASLPVRMSSQHGRAISSYRTRPMHLGLLHAVGGCFRGSLPETATETCTHTPTCNSGPCLWSILASSDVLLYMETPMDSNMTGPRHLGLLHAIVAFFRGSLPETATETCTHTPTCNSGPCLWSILASSDVLPTWKRQWISI